MKKYRIFFRIYIIKIVSINILRNGLINGYKKTGQSGALVTHDLTQRISKSAITVEKPGWSPTRTRISFATSIPFFHSCFDTATRYACMYHRYTRSRILFLARAARKSLMRPSKGSSKLQSNEARQRKTP